MFFVTSFHKKGYNLYGKNMLDSFLKYSSIPIKIYYEDYKPEIKDSRVEYINIFDVNPDLVKFIDRNKHKRVTNFKYDGIRFSYKVFSFTHAGLNSSDDWMFWIDADTIFKQKIDEALLVKKIKECSGKIINDIDENYLVCFMRKNKIKKKVVIPSWTECGFVGYNLRKKSCIHFLKDFRNRYAKDYIYKEAQQHDSWIFDVVQRKINKVYGEKPLNLNPSDYTHPIVMTPMGDIIDHLKGRGRKIKGYSPEAK